MFYLRKFPEKYAKNIFSRLNIFSKATPFTRYFGLTDTEFELNSFSNDIKSMVELFMIIVIHS